MNTEKTNITVISIDPFDKDIIDRRVAKSILLVPDNWPSIGNEYEYPSTVESVIKLLRQKIPVDSLYPITATTPLQDNQGLDWIAPTLLVSGLLLTQYPMAVTIALGVIANYVTHIFMGFKSDPKIKLNIVQTVADGKKAQRVHYEGPVSGLNEVEKVLSTFFE